MKKPAIQVFCAFVGEEEAGQILRRSFRLYVERGSGTPRVYGEEPLVPGDPSCR